MAVFTGNGYLVDDLAALTAIPAIDRPAFKVALLVAGLGWYEYDNAATSGGIVPDDSPASGQWFPVSREVLRANRTYFVRTDGNDSNNGLTNTSGGAFLTAIGARDAISKIDGNGFNVTVQFADGTYNTNQSVVWSKFVGISTLFLAGNTTTPSNVSIVATSGIAPVTGVFQFEGDQSFDLNGFSFTNAQTSGLCIKTANGAKLVTRNNSYGAATRGHIEVTDFSSLQQIGNMTITGNSLSFLYVTQASAFFQLAGVGTITGTPNFGFAFFGAASGGVIYWISNEFSWSGAATGKRHDASTNGIIQTYGIGTPLPGGTSGTTSTGGQYL